MNSIESILSWKLNISNFELDMSSCELDISSYFLNISSCSMYRVVNSIIYRVVYFLTLSRLNLLWSSSSTTSRELLSRFSTCNGLYRVLFSIYRVVNSIYRLLNAIYWVLSTNRVESSIPSPFLFWGDDISSCQLKYRVLNSIYRVLNSIYRVVNWNIIELWTQYLEIIRRMKCRFWGFHYFTATINYSSINHQRQLLGLYVTIAPLIIKL